MPNKYLCAFALIFCLATASVAHAVVTIDFENLVTQGYLEGDHVTSLFVTDPATGYSTTVTFSVFNSTGTTGTPILVEEGEVVAGMPHAFWPADTPAGEVYGNGNDWFLGNGTGVPDNYRFEFSSPVEDLTLDMYDFRSDGPFTFGTPGSDTAFLDTFNQSGGAHPLNLWVSTYTVPDPRPIDGQTVNLWAPHTDIYTAELVFAPDSVDAGTAVDNLTFTIVPEPGIGTMGLLAFGLLGLIRRK